MKSICVYCSSSDDIEKVYFRAASELGRFIAQSGYTLIYGGGVIGLMGELAKSVQKHGGRVTGIIPKSLAKKGIMYELAEVIIETTDLRARKEQMEKRADAFIALPGGFGTLEEISEIITLKQLRSHNKPVVFLNTNKFFDSLLGHFEKCFREKFVKKKYRDLYFVADGPSAAMEYIKNETPRRVTGVKK